MSGLFSLLVSSLSLADRCCRFSRSSPRFRVPSSEQRFPAFRDRCVVRTRSGQRPQSNRSSDHGVERGLHIGAVTCRRIFTQAPSAQYAASTDRHSAFGRIPGADRHLTCWATRPPRTRRRWCKRRSSATAAAPGCWRRQSHRQDTTAAAAQPRQYLLFCYIPP